MNVSVFDVIGPVMVGPSSSHTAGAVKLGRLARIIAGGSFTKVHFGLHGSFAKTYQGHGTDIALLAGVLGLDEDNEEIPNAMALADEAGLEYAFSPIELENAHENTVVITLFFPDRSTHEIEGSSIGGGQVLINRIDDFDCAFSGQSPTLVIQHKDRVGVVSDITRIVSANNINIAIIRLSRNAKGGTACCILETDSAIPKDVRDQLRGVPNVIDVKLVQKF